MRNTESFGLALYDTTDKMNITGSENSLNRNMELIDAALDGHDQEMRDLDSRIGVIENKMDIPKASKNLFDESAIELGKYWRCELAKKSTDYNDPPTYFLSGRIEVTPGETIWFKYEARFITAFDSNDAALTDKGSESVRSYTVPDGVQFIRFSGFVTNLGNEFMVNRGDALLPYEPFDVEEDAQEYATKNELAMATSLCGGNSVTVTADTLDSGTKLETTDFPYNLKKGIGMTLYAKFTEFTSVTLGKGYQSYRGDYVRVTAENVEWVHHESSSETVYEQKAHGLSISGFVALSWRVGDDMRCRFTVETLGGMYSGAFESKNWTEANGAAFAMGQQHMTGVELRAAALDIRCPMWLFGDSYFGVSGDRVLGQLKNLGSFGGLLIVGLAGMASNGAYNDNLDKLIRMGGMPRYVVWCEGMNSTAEVHAEYIDKLLALKEQYGFELILYKVPTVPDRTGVNNANNVKILSTGCRYVDAYKAVGTDDAGNWYEGYLSSDGVHPTELGAKAIAHRILMDVPEIMQFGYNAGSIGGTTSGDL